MRGARWIALLKTAIYLGITINVALFVRRGTPAEAAESLAWFALLLLFTIDFRYAKILSTSATHVLRVARLGASAIVIAAAVAYLQEAAWWDALDAWLWIAVVVLLELEVRLPALARRQAVTFRWCAAVLYSSLCLLVIVFAKRGAWFDAYDAALWLAAFAVIEQNALQTLRPASV